MLHVLGEYGVIFTEFVNIDQSEGPLQFDCLTSSYFGALQIFAGKVEVNVFVVLVFNGNAHIQ